MGDFSDEVRFQGDCANGCLSTALCMQRWNVGPTVLQIAIQRIDFQSVMIAS